MPDQLEVLPGTSHAAPSRRPRAPWRRAAPRARGSAWRRAPARRRPPASSSELIRLRVEVNDRLPRARRGSRSRGSRSGVPSTARNDSPWLISWKRGSLRTPAGPGSPRGRCRSRASSRPAGRTPSARLRDRAAGAGTADSGDSEAPGAVPAPGRATLGAQPVGHRDRLDERGLARPVLADQERHARGQRQPVPQELGHRRDVGRPPVAGKRPLGVGLAPAPRAAGRSPWPHARGRLRRSSLSRPRAAH